MTFDSDDSGLGQVMRDFNLRVQHLEALGYGPVTSRMRTPARNVLAGGASRSQHLIGTAADFAILASQWAQFQRDARAVGLIAVNELARPGHGPHAHVQLFPAGKAPESLFTAAAARTPGIQIQETP